MPRNAFSAATAICLGISAIAGISIAGSQATGSSTPPTVVGISPTGGVTAGGTDITVYGSGFVAGGTSVDVGTAVATNVNVVSANELTAITSSSNAGAVDARVTTAAGVSPTSIDDGFTYGSNLPIVHAEVAGLTQVEVTWSPPVGSAVSGYSVFRNGTQVGTTDGYTTNYLDSGLSPGTQYTYSVAAQSGATTQVAAPPVSTASSGGATTHILTQCSSTSLPAGSYLLSGNLVVPAGQPCLEFDSVQGVSLDCMGNTITSQFGSTTNYPTLALRDVSNFLVVNCNFYEQDPLVGSPTGDDILSVNDGSSNGVFEDDSFDVSQGNAWISLQDTSQVAFNTDVMTNTVASSQSGTGDYIGWSTFTRADQGTTDDNIGISNGSHNVFDHDNLIGDADLTGYAHPAGSDDNIGVANEASDTFADNHIDSAFDCGLETGSLFANSLITGNVFDNSWAAAVCSYWNTSWVNNVMSGNTVAYSGTVFTLNGANVLATGQTANYLLANTFSGNSSLGGSDNLFGNSASIGQWENQPIPLVVGDNNFTDNNFGTSQPAPMIDPNAVSPVIGSQSGNECQLPSAELICTAPVPVPTPVPAVVGLDPPNGTLAGGTDVTVEGSDFTGATEVFFGSQAATSVTVLADSRLIATSPISSSGRVDLTVATVGGTSGTSADDVFTYGQSPAVSSVSPAIGALKGGDLVTITGENLTGASQVNFGPLAIGPSGFKVNSATSISLSSPPPSPGWPNTVNITVTTPSGTSPVTGGISSQAVSDSFTYSPVAVDVSTGLNSPAGIVTDAGGDVFSANYGNGTVSVLPKSSGSIFGTSVVAGLEATLVTGMNQPTGLAFDSSGDLYIADAGNNTVSVLPETSGTIFGTSVKADSLTKLATGLSTPNGLAFDSAGNLFIANWSNGTIAVLPKATGTIFGTSVSADTLAGVTSGLSLPEGLAFDSSGNLYIAGFGNGTVSVLPGATGSVFGSNVTADRLSTVASGLNNPWGLAFDASGDLYIANSGNDTVSVLAKSTNTQFGVPANGNNVTPAVLAGLNSPHGLAVDSLGDLYISNLGNGTVSELVHLAAIQSMSAAQGTALGGTSVTITGSGFDNATSVDFGSTPATSFTVNATGTSITAISPPHSAGVVDVSVTTLAPVHSPFAGADKFTFVSPILTPIFQSIESGPEGDAFDAAGNLYVALNTLGTLVVVPKASGTLFGHTVTEGVATTLVTGLSHPTGVAVDPSGNVFVTDFGSGSITVLPAATGTLFGVATTADVAETLVSGQGLIAPTGLAVDTAGNLYVSNASASEIEVLPEASGTIFGQSVTSGKLNSLVPSSVADEPTGLAFDAQGNLYFANYATGTIDALPVATGTLFGKSVTANTPATVLSGLASPCGVAFDSSGSLYVANVGNNAIGVLPTRTGTSYSVPIPANVYAPLLPVGSGPNSPEGLAIDSAGDLYVGNYGSATIGELAPGNLSSFYDSGAVTDDVDPWGGNFDGVDFSYSAQALATAGVVPGGGLVSGGVDYVWPNAGSGLQDNVIPVGQSIDVPTLSGETTLGVLGSATNGSSVGTMTISYTDGSTQAVQLGMSDWTLGGGGGQPSYGNLIVANAPYRNNSSGEPQTIGTYLFAASVPVSTGKTVMSVTLPTSTSGGQMHVFAIGSNAGPLTNGN